MLNKKKKKAEFGKDKSRKSRRVLIWARALAALWIVGIGLGFGANLLIGPSMTNQSNASATAIPTTTSPPPTSIIETTTTRSVNVEDLPANTFVSDLVVQGTHIEDVV